MTKQAYKLTITTPRDFKRFIERFREDVIEINNVAFKSIYPMIEASNTAASWYNVQDSSNVYFNFPIEVTVYN